MLHPHLQQLEFLAPEPQLSFLKILPSVVHLSPAAGARIEVQFCPPGTRSPETSAVTGDLTAAATVNHDPDTAGGLGAPTSSDGAVVGNAKSTKSIQEDVVAAGERCIAKAAPDSGLMLDGDEGSIVDVPLFVGEVQESRAQGSNLGASAAGVAGVDTDMPGSRSGMCGGSDVEPWSRHGKWKVPCFVKPVEGRNQLPPLALEVRGHVDSLGYCLMVSRWLLEPKSAQPC